MPSMKSLAVTAAIVLAVIYASNKIPALAKLTGKAA